MKLLKRKKVCLKNLNLSLNNSIRISIKYTLKFVPGMGLEPTRP